MANMFVERLSKGVKYEEVYLKAYNSLLRLVANGAHISTFTTIGENNKALTEEAGMRFTMAHNPKFR